MQAKTATAPRLMIRLPNWVGDVCMSLPVIALCRALGLEVAVAGRPWAGDLLAGLPLAAILPLRGGLGDDVATLRAWRGAKQPACHRRGFRAGATGLPCGGTRADRLLGRSENGAIGLERPIARRIVT